MQRPNFEKRKGSIIFLQKGSKPPKDYSVEEGMQVMVKYKEIDVDIKVTKKISELEYIGTIIKFSAYTGPNTYNDLYIGKDVEFLKEHIVVLFRQP